MFSFNNSDHIERVFLIAGGGGCALLFAVLIYSLLFMN